LHTSFHGGAFQPLAMRITKLRVLYDSTLLFPLFSFDRLLLDGWLDGLVAWKGTLVDGRLVNLGESSERGWVALVGQAWLGWTEHTHEG
jgi:hypothetical protein